MKNSGPKPPRHLSAEARKFWRSVVECWELDAPALKILEGVCEALDRVRQAQELLKKQGPVIKDRFKQQKVHPAALIERDSRQAILRGLAALGLELEPIQDRAGRPPGRR